MNVVYFLLKFIPSDALLKSKDKLDPALRKKIISDISGFDTLDFDYKSDQEKFKRVVDGSKKGVVIAACLIASRISMIVAPIIFGGTILKNVVVETGKSVGKFFKTVFD